MCIFELNGELDKIVLIMLLWLSDVLSKESVIHGAWLKIVRNSTQANSGELRISESEMTRLNKMPLQIELFTQVTFSW